MSSRVITPGPYRATKLWNEVTRLFRAGMPLRKHRQNLRHYASCFPASAAVEWLHQLLRSNSNFGPDVTRQQTVQLLKKFLKNHVIEDVKGRWGTEDLEDNNVLYRFPSTSSLKPIPCPSSGSIKKRPSFRDKDSFFRFKSLKKQHEEETLENVDPAPQEGGENHPIGEQQVPRRELTVEDEQEIWRDITVTHLQRILGVASLDEVLDHRRINPHNIIHNMTNVNKHGVVTLDDKTILLTEHIFSWTLGFSLPRVLLTFEPRSDPSDLSIIPLDDLPHWVLSAMKSLANWPKYDSAQPSYPGFERDVFKTVSDYFYSLPQPVLTYELYELFINVLVFCGYVAAPATHPRGKRKKAELPSAPPPAKTSFRSTECLLLSLLRQGTCDEAESPMGEVLGGKLQSRLAALKGGDQLGGSSARLSAVGLTRPRAKSCSLETILDDSAPLTRQQLFLSNDSLASCAYGNGSRSDGPAIATPRVSSVSKATASTWENGPAGTIRSRLPVGGVSERSRSSQPRSLGSCLDIVMETREEDTKEFKLPGRATSCLNVSSPADQLPSAAWGAPSLSRHLPYFSSHHLFPSSSSSALDKAQGSHAAAGPSGPGAASSTCNLWTLPPATVGRRCLSSLDVSKLPRPVSLFKPPVCVPDSISLHPPPNPEHSLLQSHCERVAIEALQLCTLLLPPSSRRKLQLLMRMMSRISQNVDMPRLHPAIGTRTLMIHTFSGCVLGSAVECDLDELLATRLVSFLMDHQQSILSVPEYLLSAINDHIRYLRAVQVPIDGGDPVCAPMPMYAFCRQISGAEFEQQKLESSQKAMEELLEMLLTNQKMGEKDRRKKLKQFQKQYPDIYSRRFPSTDGEKMSDKPKIKPPLFNIRKTKAFSIRN